MVGRWIQIQQTRRDYLTLCEVRVYGSLDVKLVSQRRPTKQSSEGWSGRPSRAVDGNTNQRYPSKSCSHTQRSGRPWWRVDLQKRTKVQKVMIWNRSDCCQSRLNRVEVKVDGYRCGIINRATRINTVYCGFRSGRYVWVKQLKSDYLTLCEVRVYGAQAVMPKRSGVKLLSQRKRAWQSSEGWSGRPSRAVDGNTNGRYSSASCTHTQNRGHPWWQVDLGRYYQVTKVAIWNRSDCCRSRLNNVVVKVDGRQCGRIGRASNYNSVNCNRAGRKVMVQKTNRDYLTLCEVRVYGRVTKQPKRVPPPAPFVSLRGKRTQQSSEGWSGRPSRAVDGNTNQSYRRGTCTHTQNRGHPWWRVYLGRPYKVDRVVIWNRSDCCKSRLNNVNVRVGGRHCGRIGHASSVNTVRCGNKVGSQITIQQTKRDYLTLCEVKVYGRTAGPAPKRVKYTARRGGNGGRAVHDYCRTNKFINYWQIRSGSLVDSLRGRCNDGRWLRRCGGHGGGFWQGSLNSRRIGVRSGSLIDKFNHRGGNGGGYRMLDCGSGFKISGYQLRCGALVDQVKFQCRN
jgi:hypothetical protein